MNPACWATRKQITVLGINSRFGNAVSFLLKQSPIVNRLVLYDEANTDVAHDISTIPSTCKVVVYDGEAQLRCAVKNSDVILIGDKEDPIANVDEAISRAAPDVIKYAEAISCSAPNAIVLVATHPVNTMLSLFSEVQIRNGTFDCDRVMGVTSVDTMRASAVLARHLRLEPEKVSLPVIGGSSPDTRIPLFSQSCPPVKASNADLRKMTRLVKMSECELFQLLNRGDALNKAYATVRLIDSVMSALRGQRSISQIVLSRTCLVPDVDYFSLPVVLGPKGIAHRFPVPPMTNRENILFEHAIKSIQVDKQKADDVLSRSARNDQSLTPEVTKEYNDLLDCDKKGIFVGALLDRLKTHSEACKPKLEYLLMGKKNYLKFPPDFKPSLYPHRLQFVEPDQVPNDGCCPFKLPCPPCPPQRGTTVISPWSSKCKGGASPRPYPPVVKLLRKCKVCDKGSPCEHYEGFKSLYKDSMCCVIAPPQPTDKMIQTNNPEQPEIQAASTWKQPLPGDSIHTLTNQQINCSVQTPHNLQCSSSSQSNTSEPHQITIPQSITQNSDGEIKSVVPPTISCPNVLPDNHCPYGMSNNPQIFEYNNKSPLTEQNNPESATFHIDQTATNESTNQSRVTSRHVDWTRLHSYSVPVERLVHQNSSSNRKMSIEPVEPHFSPDIENSSMYSNIDKCLFEKCLVGMKPEVTSFVPLEENSSATAMEHTNVATPHSNYNQNKMKTNNVASKPAASDSNTTSYITATNSHVVNQDPAKVPKMSSELGNYSVAESAQQVKVNSNPASFNYAGGLGISYNKLERNPDNSYVSFNPWSAYREEQYYNEQVPKPLKSKDVSKPLEGTEKHCRETPKPLAVENMENKSCALQETKEINYSFLQETEEGEEKTISNFPVPGHSASVTDEQNGIKTSEKEINHIINTTDSVFSKDVIIDRDDRSGNKIAKEEHPKGSDPAISNSRSRKSISVGVENAKLQGNDEHNQVIDKTKILGFGQVISTFIPSTNFSKRTEETSNKTTTPPQNQPQKVYVETHSNQQTDKPKENNGNVVLSISSSKDDEYDAMYQTGIDSSGVRRVDVDPEISRLTQIRRKVQAALRSIILPPKYTQKPADRVVKQENQVDRILREKMRRASKAVKAVREARKVDSAYIPVSPKLYAPKCPKRFLLSSHSDSKLVTFNNVLQEFYVAKPNKVKVPSVDSNVIEQRCESDFQAEGESSDTFPTNRNKHEVKSNVSGRNETYSKFGGCSDIQGFDYWNSEPHKQEIQIPPSESIQVIQNQLVPIQLKSAASASNSEYLKHVFANRTLKAKLADLDQLKCAINQRSKTVMTPGSCRLARKNDPKYALTSPNRLRPRR